MPCNQSSAYGRVVRTTVLRLAFFVVTATLSPIPALSGPSHVTVTRDLAWFAPGQEILSPQFSPDGDFIALATRSYIPDGGDAEGIPRSFFQAIEKQEKANPRFADPVIKVIDLHGKLTCTAKYGWNPSIAPDNEHLVFAEQVKPITGFRELASPMTGNGIRMYSCATGQTVNVADPQQGYLDRPFFSLDGSSIVYTMNEAVNGAYGGAVGIGLFDMRQHRSVTLLERQAVPAVPCPPAGSQGTTPGICSHPEYLSRSFSDIVYGISSVGSEVIALLGRPIPALGDIYLARKYDTSVVSVFPLQRTVLSLGPMSGSDATAFQTLSNERVLVFSKYWKLYSTSTGQPLPDVSPKNMELNSTYSPDFKYFLRAEAVKPGRDLFHYVLYRLADGAKLASLPRMVEPYAVAWSPRANRFAIVALTGASTARHHVEELLIYSIH